KARKLNTFFEVIPIFDATIENIENALAEIDFKDRIVAFHYGGHANGKELLLQTTTGKTKYIKAETLADFLGKQERLQLVFLNGCSTKRQVEALRKAGIPHIIATDRSIEDEEATRFSVEFYKALAAGERNISNLFEKAKKALQNESLQKSFQRKLYKPEEAANGDFSWALYELENSKPTPLGEWFVNQNRELLTTAPPTPPKAFIGRNTDLKEVHTLLEDNDNVVLVNGIGGIGKSTLAQAYWHKHQHQYSFLAWVTVVNDNLQESFLNSGLEQKLNIQIPEKSTIEERYQVLQRELSQIEGIKLLVLDNVNNPDTVHEFEMPNWKVLLTSRAAIPHYLQHTVGILSKEDAKALFVTYHPTAKEQTEILEQLLEGIGYHTLTIELLAKNLEQLHGKGYGLSDLYENLEEKGLLKPDRSLPVRIDYPTKQKEKYEAVISTMFDLQFNPLGDYARWLLLQFSVLPAISIEYGLMADFLQIGDETRGQFDEALEDLVERGWLEKKEDGYKIHQVVQEVIRVKVEPNGENCRTLVKYLGEKLYTSKWDNPLEKSFFVEYTNKLLTHLKLGKTKNIAALCTNAASIYKALGNYTKVLKFQLQSVAICKEIFELNHPNLANSYNNLAVSYYESGEYNNALDFFQKCLSIYHKKIDLNHPKLIEFYNNIGFIFQTLGKYDKSLQHLNKSIFICKSNFKLYRPNLAQAYNNIALTYNALDSYEIALQFLNKSISIREKIFKSDHPDLAVSYNNIAETYQLLGNYSEALQFQEKSVLLREKIFESNPNHPELASSYNNLAEIYKELGDYTMALKFHHKSIFIRKEINHPDLADSYNNIAETYRLLGNYSMVLQFQRKSIDFGEIFFELLPPNLACYYNNIAMTYNTLKQFDKALEYQEKSVKISERVYGANHQKLGFAYYNMAMIHRAMGNYIKALELQQKSIDIIEGTLETTHQKLTNFYFNLITTSCCAKDLLSAKKYIDKSIINYQHNFPSGHPNLTKALGWQQKVEKALKKS
ncbi:MAG: tetratricopeptide repeat protein, partial [Chitinophagales bacterium]